MAVYINVVGRQPDFGSLPAAKIIDYPLEKRDYRPFAQAQLALGPGALFVRMIAFEAHPDPESRLWLLLGMREGCFCLSAAGDGGIGLLPPLPDVHTHHIGGEDLQGVFWGTECALPLAPLEALLGKQLAPGGTLRGNILKTSAGGEMPPHFGCLYPCRELYTLEQAGAVMPEDLGEFSIVGY